MYLRYLVFCLVMGSFWFCKEPSQALEAQKPKRWAYLIGASFKSSFIEKRLADFSHLTLGVWRLNSTGVLYSSPKLQTKSWQLLSKLKKKRKLYPLISLKNATAGAKLLGNAASRRVAVTNLSRLIQKHNFDGLHIDFEFLTGKSTAGYVAFLAALKEDPAMQNRILSIAIFPPEKGTPDEQAFHDIKRLGPVIDEVIYMTYDYHLKTPGPVTAIDWARRNIKTALASIAPSRVWLGVPAYGYEWQLGTNKRPKVVTESRATKYCAQYKCRRHSSGMLLLKRPGRVAYIPDRKMHESFQRLAQELQVKGTAMWRIGFEKLP